VSLECLFQWFLKITQKRCRPPPIQNFRIQREYLFHTCEPTSNPKLESDFLLSKLLYFTTVKRGRGCSKCPSCSECPQPHKRWVKLHSQSCRRESIFRSSFSDSCILPLNGPFVPATSLGLCALLQTSVWLRKYKAKLTAFKTLQTLFKMKRTPYKSLIQNEWSVTSMPPRRGA
jgi:hypothetical protein